VNNTEFPRTVEEITPEWLTNVLRESGAIREERVESFTIAGLDGGIAGDVNRLQLNYAASPSRGPSTVIAKFAHLNDQKRSGINRAGFYEREVRFYRQLGPVVGIPTPAAHSVEYDRDSGHFVLLLEDLSRFRSIREEDGCSPENARTAVQALAKMHARWWESDQLNEMNWLMGFRDAEIRNQMSNRYNKALGRFLEIGEGYLPAGYELVARKYGESLQSVVSEMGSSPATLTHGDFRLANLVFNDEPGASDPLYAFDWQTASRGKAAVDVAYFFGRSLATDSRRLHESQLLADYHDSLVDHGVANYSFDEFNIDVRISAFRLMHIATATVVNLGQHLLETEEGLHHVKTLCGRLQMLIDWNCDEVIPK
jgi:hypothetical protein